MFLFYHSKIGLVKSVVGSKLKLIVRVTELCGVACGLRTRTQQYAPAVVGAARPSARLSSDLNRHRARARVGILLKNPRIAGLKQRMKDRKNWDRLGFLKNWRFAGK